jgi:hypothetical protein
MRSFPSIRRRALVAVVSVGAVASIATSKIPDQLTSYVDVGLPHLEVSHPVATYHLRATGTGTLSKTAGHVEVNVDAAVRTGASTLLSATSSVDHVVADAGALRVRVACDRLPCADDVYVRVELRPNADGTWPGPSDWNVTAGLVIDATDGSIPADAGASLSVVP